MKPGLSAVLAAFVCILSHAGSARAQSPCDPSLPRNDAQAAGYKQRSDRCEGIYKRDVGSYGVQLVSFVAAPAFEDICVPGQAVHLIWPGQPTTPASAPVHLQVESFRRQLYYRLDTNRPPRSTSYEWPDEPRCSSEVRLKVPELGILARTQSSLGPKPVDVLLPVMFSTRPVARVSPPYRAVLVPGRRVSEVYVSLWYYGSAQNPTRVVPERPLAMKPYPTGVPITVELSAGEVKNPGLYRLRTSVEFESGELEALDLYFLNGS